ncbi:hypothetical protein SAMN04488061_1216 [Filomicrobium insigne]|uniref:Uncharacterized protein n=1 Tax=Filomicrobium insigne TaxID=418854 RepID=A0A1H0JNC5_9HYPH|nr:hypothetical protein SAMN04488061_1216 [Filomicrobium insigne]
MARSGERRKYLRLRLMGPQPKSPSYGGTDTIWVEAVVLNSDRHYHPCPSQPNSGDSGRDQYRVSRTAGFSSCSKRQIMRRKKAPRAFNTQESQCGRSAPAHYRHLAITQASERRSPRHLHRRRQGVRGSAIPCGLFGKGRHACCLTDARPSPPSLARLTWRVSCLPVIAAAKISFLP